MRVAGRSPGRLPRPPVDERSVAGLPVRTAAMLLSVFLVATAGYLWLWNEAPLLDGDSPQYLEVARDLADGRLDALHFRTPGYPLLLVLTGSVETGTRALFVVSLVLHFASLWWLAAALRACGSSHRAILAWAGLMSLPPFVEPAGYVLTESLAQFLLATGVGSLVVWLGRRRWWLLGLSASAFALSALTRPVYQALSVVIGACLLLGAGAAGVEFRRKDAVRAALVQVASAVLIVGAFAGGNYLRFDYFGLTPSAGFHLSTKTMALWERLPDDYAVEREILVRARDRELTKRGGTHTGTQAVWAAQADLLAATGLSPPELSSRLLGMNLALIRRAPLEYLREVARSLSGYWFPAAGPLASLDSTLLRWLWAILHAAVVGVLVLQLVVLAGLLAFRAGTARGGAPPATTAVISATGSQILAFLVAGGVVVYTMLLSCFLDIGEVRQRRATDVLVVFMCFVGWQVWRRTRRTASRPEADLRP